MAQRTSLKDQSEFIVLTKREVVDIISFLTAQLADVNVREHQTGACPEIIIHSEGQGLTKLYFMLESSTVDI